MLPDELSGFPLDRTLRFAERADRAGLQSVWKQEASGSNGSLTLGATAGRTDDVGVAIGVASVFSRTPALLGMSAVTLDHLSGGRGLLGLGVSSPPLVESWHGLVFERFRAGDREGGAEAVTAEMLEELAVHGTESAVREGVAAWHDAGADVVVAMPSMADVVGTVENLIDVLGAGT